MMKFVTVKSSFTESDHFMQAAEMPFKMCNPTTVSSKSPQCSSSAFQFFKGDAKRQ